MLSVINPSELVNVEQAGQDKPAQPLFGWRVFVLLGIKIYPPRICTTSASSVLTKYEPH